MGCVYADETGEGPGGEEVMEEEIWRKVPGYPKIMASNMGRIKKTKNDKLYSQFADENGYLRIKHDKKRHRVHQLVAKTFLGPRPEGNVTRHLDGVKSNNRVKNLAYGMIWENHQDNVRIAAAGGQAKITGVLTPEMILTFWSIILSGGSRKQAAKILKVSYNNISKIARGKIWHHCAAECWDRLCVVPE